MSENNLFPRRGQIFQGNIENVKDTVARPSLDTLYEVDFSFGNYQTWLGKEPTKNRTQGTNFMRKMSLMCTQAEIPGTSFIESSVTGHHQGITEAFPNLRNFPPLNLVFYCDADQVILEVLESWMSYINPVFTSSQRDRSAFTRFNYPEDYKEIIHITKFERDSFIKHSRSTNYKSSMTQFEFVNVWPTNLTSMRVAYGQSNVLKCSMQFAYDRFFTSFDGLEGAVPVDRVSATLDQALIAGDGYINKNVDPKPNKKKVIPQYQKNRNKLNKSRRKRGSGVR